MKPLKIFISTVLACLMAICLMPKAWAFCGFYVSKADTKLYNQASQVIIARDRDRTILTMANDYQGEAKDFAIVVPVPEVLQQEQVRIGEQKIIERLDAFSAPRLVEYFDSNPCALIYPRSEGALRSSAQDSAAEFRGRRENSLGVTVEAEFSVGEYDIVILSAKESNGLQTWLNRNGYKIPAEANQLLRPYIRNGMKFFVAKVNLTEFQRGGYQFLRPIMIAYNSPRFMLPIRLGMTNANQPQDLIAYILTPTGRAELTNYRMTNIPSDARIPRFVKNEFGDFYKAMFETAYDREGRNTGFVEYAWDMSSCDPCSADPLSPEELQQAGVFWLDGSAPVLPPGRVFAPPRPNRGVFITRLHVRYTRNKFPADLMFQETSNRQLFQGRYILQHPFEGSANCAAGEQYRRSLPQRFEQEAQTLAKLTSWDINEIRRKAQIGQQQSESAPFWRNIWR